MVGDLVEVRRHADELTTVVTQLRYQLVRVTVYGKDGNSAPFGDILIIHTADRGWLVDGRSF